LATSEQHSAMIRLQQMYGQTAGTRDTLNYRRVECTVDGKRYWAHGQTWNEAIEALMVKVLP